MVIEEAVTKTIKEVEDELPVTEKEGIPPTEPEHSPDNLESSAQEESSETD